jgi:HD-GYP domain-containing protein (c-di-GMP phosphodiesterase class II)
MLKKIPTNELRLGMYISELDRPWTESNFLFQGLLLETTDDIDQVQKQCSYVFIDSDEATESSIREFGIHTSNPRAGIREILNDIPHDYDYPVTLPIERELESAKQAYNRAASVFHSVWNRVREYKTFNSAEFRPAIQNIVGSVIRNPDAFLLLRTICDDKDYNCRHALNSCALASAFARHLGLYPEELVTIATGAFLLDIGKARMPEELLNKRGPLTEDEVDLLHQHATFGVEVLNSINDIPGPVIEMVKSHHERDNGKGYPAAIDGNQIPVYARMAAIVDCFDAITIERPYKKPVTAFEALHIIDEASNIDFQKGLSEAFTSCLGVYPTGSTVELSNGYTATVIEQNPASRKRPRVLLLNANGRPLDKKRIIIDLNSQFSSAADAPIEISKVLTNDLPDSGRLNGAITKAA